MKLLDSWRRKRKVAPIPVPCTPQMLAAVLLDQVQQGEIENIVVLRKRKNGRYSADYTTMNTTDMLMHEKAIQQLAREFYDSADA